MRLLIVRGYKQRILELQYLPHPSQSNNLTQSSHSIFSSSNLSHTASPPSQILVIGTIGAVTVQPVGFNVVKREKLGENFPFVRHIRTITVFIAFQSSGNMNHRVVLYFETLPITPVTQVDFLFLPTTNLFVAFKTNFLADQNVMSDVGADFTFHFCNNTLARPLPRNMNLNGIINICTDH